MNEIASPSSNPNPYVAKCFGKEENVELEGVDGKQTGIVFERYDKDLSSLLDDRVLYSPISTCFKRGKMSMMLEHFVDSMLDGLNLLHKNGVVHRDIKPHNILVRGIHDSCADWEFVIADLGGGVALPESNNDEPYTTIEKRAMFDFTKTSDDGEPDPRVGASPDMLPWYRSKKRTAESKESETTSEKPATKCVKAIPHLKKTPGALDLFALATLLRKYFCGEGYITDDPDFEGMPPEKDFLLPKTYCYVAATESKSITFNLMGRHFRASLDGELQMQDLSIGETKALVLMREVFRGLGCKREAVDMSKMYGGLYAGTMYQAMVCTHFMKAKEIDGNAIRTFLNSMFPMYHGSTFSIYALSDTTVAKVYIRSDPYADPNSDDRDTTMMKHLCTPQCPESIVKWIETKRVKLGDEWKDHVRILERFDGSAGRVSCFDGEDTKRRVDLYVKQVFDAIRHVHTAGYIHTEIKLDNVFVNIKEPKFALGNFENSVRIDITNRGEYTLLEKRKPKHIPWFQSDDDNIHPILISTGLKGRFVPMIALDNWAFLLSLIEICKRVHDGSCVKTVNGDHSSEDPVVSNVVHHTLHHFFGTHPSCKYRDSFVYNYEGIFGGGDRVKWNHGGVVCASEDELVKILDMLSHDDAVEKIIHSSSAVVTSSSSA